MAAQSDAWRARSEKPRSATSAEIDLRLSLRGNLIILRESNDALWFFLARNCRVLSHCGDDSDRATVSATENAAEHYALPRRQRHENDSQHSADQFAGIIEVWLQ